MGGVAQGLLVQDGAGAQGGRRCTCTRCTRASWPSASGHLRYPFSGSQALNFFQGSHYYTVAFVTPVGCISALQIILHKSD